MHSQYNTKKWLCDSYQSLCFNDNTKHQYVINQYLFFYAHLFCSWWFYIGSVLRNFWFSIVLICHIIILPLTLYCRFLKVILGQSNQSLAALESRFWLWSFIIFLKAQVGFLVQRFLCGLPRFAAKERFNWMQEDDKSCNRSINHMYPSLPKRWLRPWQQCTFDLNKYE